jgi:hypothetical protein
MKMKKHMFLFMSVALSGCADAQISRDKADTYTVRYEHEAVYSPSIGERRVQEAALKSCNGGKWQIISQYHNPTDGAYGVSEWKIKCM